ncbi:hypothetical protein P692DRAFT_201190773 [Suillus brevipes Sb2]|nr:hypothetical protein P692DRAFT_201190773 [Suillus brevipes Sb2]
MWCKVPGPTQPRYLHNNPLLAVAQRLCLSWITACHLLLELLHIWEVCSICSLKAVIVNFRLTGHGHPICETRFCTASCGF